jgi:SAM-dependent methyltransferase
MATRYDEGIVGNAQGLSERRLELLESAVDPQTFMVLAARGVRPSWRCLELGAGRGSVARWLAERCPDGQVIATDLDPRLVDAGGLPNLTVLRHDAATDDFDPASFDLIHCRAVLSHIATRETVLAKAASWLAPGGWLVVEEPLISPLGDSANVAFQRLYDGIERCLIMHQSTDMRWARNAGRSIGGLGLTQIGLTVSCLPNGQGNPWDEMWRVTADQVAPTAIQQGFLTEDEVAAGLALFDDPSFIDVGFAFVSAWGRRPPPAAG